MNALLDMNIQQAANNLKVLAADANNAAAKARVEQRYSDAEALDRRAEALHCAAHLTETRGLA